MKKNKFKLNGKLWTCFIIVFVIVGILCLFFIERNRNKPIIIGLSVQLTGAQSEMGIQERNGAQLAVDKINASGGIGGRKISLIIHDDLGKNKEAQAGDRELIKEGAVAIIGHVTSEQTMAALKVTNPAGIVMISPTVSNPKLSGLDDYFFRVYPSFKYSSENFAKYVFKEEGKTRIAMIYDKDNLAYSKTYSEVFGDKFQSLGGKITSKVSFSSAAQSDFSSLISQMRGSNAEALLIAASDMDTALIAQRVRLMGWNIPMFSSAWSQTQTLVNNGGKAVEGMKIEQAYALNSKSKAFIDFKSSYRARFGNDPSFGSAFSYDSSFVLAEALKKTNGNKNGLKQALLETGNFKGLTDTFSFDKFGDVNRPYYLSTINNEKYIIIKRLNSVN